MPQLGRRVRRALLVAVIGLLLTCVLGAALSALSNQGLAWQSTTPERLSPREQMLLAEAEWLRGALGDTVWPGWGAADVPAIRYNEAYAFLVGLPDPEPGWVKVPAGAARGGPWEEVTDTQSEHARYYRQPLPAPGQTPEAFAVRVGTRWVGSAPTMEWLKIGLRDQIRAELPPLLAPLAPYRLVDRLFVGSSDWYIALTLHESFHAYQGLRAPERLAAAEKAAAQGEGRYPWDDAALAEGWQTELEALIAAVRASTRDETVAQARRFLLLRAARRSERGLSSTLIEYERQREWLEGSAKYVELAIWRAAATGDYVPTAAIAADPDFQRYRSFERHWEQEVAQIGRSAAGDGRLYYSGMAQAMLLDRLASGWQEQLLAEGVWLETLLAEALP